MEWVESAEIKPVKIDKEFGIKQSNIAMILMLSLLVCVILVTFEYIIIFYGDTIIEYFREILSYGNFLNASFIIMAFTNYVIYLVGLVYSIRAIFLGRLGIKNKVNTKKTFNRGLTSLILSSLYILVFTVLIVVNLNI